MWRRIESDLSQNDPRTIDYRNIPQINPIVTLTARLIRLKLKEIRRKNGEKIANSSLLKAKIPKKVKFGHD
jgi:hypothetical protein